VREGGRKERWREGEGDAAHLIAAVCQVERETNRQTDRKRERRKQRDNERQCGGVSDWKRLK